MEVRGRGKAGSYPNANGWREQRMRQVRPVVMRAGMAIALALVLFAGAGPGSGWAQSPSTVAQIAMYKGADRQARLEAGAQREGRLTLYSSLNLEESQPIIEAFTKKYPFIRTEIYRASGEDVALKLITEYRGRKFLADVLETTGVDVAKVLKEGFLQQFFSPRAGSLPRAAKDPKGLWVMTRANMIVLGFNTRLVPDAEVPKTYDDLLNPKWKGKMSLEAEDQIWLATLWEFWGEAKAREYFTRLGQQALTVRKGHTVLAELIAAGEIALSPNIYNHRPDRMRRRGAPIDWLPLIPVVAVPHMISLPKNATNPHAAMLWIDFVLSKEGQTELAKQGRVPIHPLVAADPPRLNTGFRFITLDPMKFLDKFDFYNRLWEELLIKPR